jgi:hypothetical protein
VAHPVSEPDHAPRSRLTARVRRDVLVDRAAFRLVTATAARAAAPDPSALARVGAEVTEALHLFEERGWLAQPATYHRDPPAPEGMRTRDTSGRGLRYAAVTWDDGYECWPEEPGAARYAGYEANRIVRAMLLEHRSGDRPWLVCVHGFGMGSPGIDLRGFRAEHLYRDLGLNLAFLTLPFHGRRGGRRRGLPRFPGVDAMDNLHGLAQAVWDVRQLLAYVRSRTGQPVGIMGLSLGGCVTALVASLADVHAAVLLVPLVDMPRLMLETAERQGASPDTIEVARRAVPLMAPVSPLALTPRVPRERRFIVAGTLDRFVRPTGQAVALVRHWDDPEVTWYHGGHISMFWDRRARTAIDAALRRVLPVPESGGVPRADAV